MQPFQPTPNAVATGGKPHISTDKAAVAATPSKADLNMEIRRNVYDGKGKDLTPASDKEKQTNGENANTNGTSGDGGVKSMDTTAREAKKIFHCFSCGIDCTRLRFHYAKSAPVSANPNAPDTKYNLCPNCFLQGRLPSSHHASDFVKLEDTSHTTIPDRNAPWSRSETILLLEALENFDDDWHQVASHVGTRTEEECVMKFLTLEIEDTYLEDASENASALMRAISGREPISQLENPVLSVVAFLAQMAEPAVAAAAAGRSVDEIRRELHKQLDKGFAGSSQGKGKNKEKEGATEGETMKTEDSMEVETAEKSDDTALVTRSAGEQQKTSPSSLANIALATSAARSGALASHEEREMTRLVGAAVNITLQKFETKLSQFTELEEVLDSERRDLEAGRHQLFLDRLGLKKRIKEVEEALKAASLAGPNEGLSLAANAQTVGIGDRHAFQADSRTAIQPYSAEGGDYKTFEM